MRTGISQQNIFLEEKRAMMFNEKNQIERYNDECEAFFEEFFIHNVDEMRLFNAVNMIGKKVFPYLMQNVKFKHWIEWVFMEIFRTEEPSIDYEIECQFVECREVIEYFIEERNVDIFLIEFEEEIQLRIDAGWFSPVDQKDTTEEYLRMEQKRQEFFSMM